MSPLPYFLGSSSLSKHYNNLSNSKRNWPPTLQILFSFAFPCCLFHSCPEWFTVIVVTAIKSSHEKKKLVWCQKGVLFNQAVV